MVVIATPPAVTIDVLAWMRAQSVFANVRNVVCFGCLVSQYQVVSVAAGVKLGSILDVTNMSSQHVYCLFWLVVMLQNTCDSNRPSRARYACCASVLFTDQARVP